MKRGAADYLPKPFTPAQVRLVAQKIAERHALETQVQTLRERLQGAAPDVRLESQSPVMQRMLDLSRQVVSGDTTVLLRGESGTGKSVLAEAIHMWSPRSDRPFTVVHCPPLPVELAESELFGHTKGAFTGAVEANSGRVVWAEGGTLFLDEIGDLPLRLQAKLEDREQELLAAASEDVVRLRNLVNDLLDLSKIEAGKIDLDFDEVPVALLFDKTLQSLQSQAEDSGVELSTRLPDPTPNVWADANKITWVLTNLVANALRYTDAGGHIELRAETAGSKVHLSVEDDGQRIPYAYQSKIFDKFVQVEGSSSVGGSGLGLAICKEVIRAHGGSIWVDSTPGLGSTFTFTLPVAASPS
jgi:two-component sensor histidine kinase